MLIALGASQAAASSLDQYRARVRRAATALDDLRLEEAAAEEGETDARELARARAAALSEARAALPAQMMVEWDGATLRADNAWLDQEIKAYERAAGSSSQERAAALARISERLHALGERIDELAGRAPARRGDERERLEAILGRFEQRQKASDDRALARLQKQIREVLLRFIEWLRELFPAMPRIQPAGGGPGSTLYWVVIGVLAAGALVVLFLIARTLIRRRQSKGPRKAARRERVILGERLAPDQTGVDLLAEAEALARAGDVRGAIRRAYIALLCELGDRKILRLAQHKTNRDYLRDLQPRPALHTEMQPLTASFERHWYGLEPATPEDWSLFRSGCESIVQNPRLKVESQSAVL